MLVGVLVVVQTDTVFLAWVWPLVLRGYRTPLGW